MRTAVLALLVACGSRAAAPDPAEFRKMTPEQQCNVTAPRAARCADELLIESLRVIGSDMPDFVDETEKKIADEPRADPTSALKMHEVQCKGDPGYTSAVVACWNLDDCKEFAACVMHTPAK